jgi:hypothetical protein
MQRCRYKAVSLNTVRSAESGALPAALAPALGRAQAVADAARTSPMATKRDLGEGPFTVPPERVLRSRDTRSAQNAYSAAFPARKRCIPSLVYVLLSQSQLLTAQPSRPHESKYCICQHCVQCWNNGKRIIPSRHYRLKRNPNGICTSPFAGHPLILATPNRKSGNTASTDFANASCVALRTRTVAMSARPLASMSSWTRTSPSTRSLRSSPGYMGCGTPGTMRVGVCS